MLTKMTPYLADLDGHVDRPSLPGPGKIHHLSLLAARGVFLD